MTSPRLMPACVGRAAGLDAADDGAADLLEPEALGQIGGHGLDGDAELRATHTPSDSELVHHVPRHVRGNREADADVAVGHRDDLRVDADELALRVDERAAGVAVVDRRIGLQEVFVAAVTHAGRSTLRADDAHRHRLTDAERIADREHDIADLDRVGVAERQRLQVGLRRPSTERRSLG